jgi:hypothetical protein
MTYKQIINVLRRVAFLLITSVIFNLNDLHTNHIQTINTTNVKISDTLS